MVALVVIVLGLSGQFIVYIFFYERYFKCEKSKQKHQSNIQTNISISKQKIYPSNIQPNTFKQKSI